MNAKTINQFPIRNYLANLGIQPTKDNSYYGMYHSPLRQDQNASFKVDFNKNLWHDFGTNEGGTLIDLVMQMGNCSFHEAATKLERNLNTFSFHGNAIPDEKKNDTSTMVIQNIAPITHPKLVEWIQQRNVDLNVARLYCREVHYQNQVGNYFALGFGNDKGGYELSSPPNFKSCISPKEITTIRNNQNICLVFEGFWDFLSYLTIQKIEKSKHDIVVLNSVANVQKAMDFLKSHKEIYTYLDNDDAGKKATKLIQSEHSVVHNRSTKFADYKDLNDYLCQKPIQKSSIKIQKSKGRKM
ncbi:MAG: toprim domain-containing protein [Dysgonamonadaceae bacterium]|jgi:DNA primase|nr:toprim domain-containing protein [Dysgonamonadaceae bacterium]